MRSRLALILAALLLAPTVAQAADRQVKEISLTNLLFVVLGVEHDDAGEPDASPPAEGEDESETAGDSDDDTDGDGASDGFADTDSNAGGDSSAGNTAGNAGNGSITTNSNTYSGSSTSNDRDGNLGSGDEGGADDPASKKATFLTSLVDWAIGIIFGQDRPWADKQARTR